MSSRNLEAVRLLLRPFLGQIDDFRTLKFHLHKYLPFPIAHCAVQHWFWLLNRSLISQATAFTDVASETNLSFERTCFGGRLGRDSFTLFTAMSQVSTCHLPTRAVCVWALCEWPPSNGANGANGWRQARHEWGEKWSGWNLTNLIGSYGPV